MILKKTIKAYLVTVLTFCMSCSLFSQEEGRSEWQAEKIKDSLYVHNKVDNPAQYPGGLNALRAFVALRISYPEKAIEEGIKGRVIVQFVIEKDGTIGNFKVLKDSIGYGTGEEIIKALQRAEKWKPAAIAGKPVRSYYVFPVDFELPE